MTKHLLCVFLLAVCVASAQSITVGNSSYGYLSGNTVFKAQSYTFGLSGSGTSWTPATTFSVTGGSAASITTQSVSDQLGSITLYAGTANGTLTIHDSTDSATATVTVVTTPTISNISTSGDANEIIINYTVVPDSYCQVQYGITSGTYLWSSYSFPSGAAGSNGTVAAVPGKCSVPIGGLGDGLTYYALPTARPDADDETNGCMTASGGCGSSEQIVATFPASTSHTPALPTAMSPSLFIEPNTTGVDAVDAACTPNCYVTVALTSTGGAECAASQTYNSPPGYASSTINSGDTLTTILSNPGSKLWHGTIFTYPEGTLCPVPNSDGAGAGYVWPDLPVDPIVSTSPDSRCASTNPIDSPCNRWIVFRTAPANESDFPPFGVRLGPSFFPKLGGFETSNYSTSGVYDVRGTILSCASSCNLDHIWIENSEFTANAALSQNYDVFFLFGRAASNQAVFPQYVVLRGNYFHSPVRARLADRVPSVQGVFLAEFQPDMQYAVVGNYADGFYYNSGQGIPQPFYFTDCGFFSTTHGWGDHIFIDDNYVEGMGMSIYGEVNNFTNPASADMTVTHNYLYYPPATLSYAQSIGFGSCRNQIEFKSGERVNISGNYINGQWACENTGNPILIFRVSDLTISSNYITNVASGINISGQIISRALSVGNFGNRVLVSNNLLYNLGRGSYQAGGGGVSAAAIEMNASPTNVTITNNTFGPISTNNGGTPGWWYPYLLVNEGGGPVANLVVKNNVFPFGMGQTAYSGGVGTSNQFQSPGQLSHPATPLMAINSSVNGVANFAGALASFAGVADGTAGSGITATETISGGSGYSNGSLSFGFGCVNASGTYYVNGGAVQYTSLSGFGVCTPGGNFTVSPGPGGALLRPQYGLDPSYTWVNNVNYCTTYGMLGEMGSHPTNANWQPFHAYAVGAQVIDRVAYFYHVQQVVTAGTSGAYPPGWNDYGGVVLDGTAIWQDMGTDYCALTNASMPGGDAWPTGANTAARQAAAGLASDYSVTPTIFNGGNAGANLNAIWSATGTVNNVSIAVSALSATVSYTAPDTRACSVDTSSDGVTWTRTSDGGGLPQRALSINGLIAATTYNYRLLCYFEQLAPLFTGSQITDGVFTTLTGSLSNPAFSFSLASFTGATHFKVTMTAADGVTQYSNTCEGSPCVVPGVPIGDYSTVRQWLAGSVAIASSDAQVVNVR